MNPAKEFQAATKVRDSGLLRRTKDGKKDFSSACSVLYQWSNRSGKGLSLHSN